MASHLIKLTSVDCGSLRRVYDVLQKYTLYNTLSDVDL